MTAHNLGWNGVVGYVPGPTVASGLYSEAFAIPRGAIVVTIFVPELVGVGDTVKLQSLFPDTSSGADDFWVDTSYLNLMLGTTPIAVAGIPQQAATTLPVTAVGSGICRFAFSAAQTGKAIDELVIKLVFGFGE